MIRTTTKNKIKGLKRFHNLLYYYFLDKKENITDILIILTFLIHTEDQ